MLAKQLKNETKKQKVGFLDILLGTLGASLLEHMSAGKGEIATKAGKGTISAGEGTIRAGQDFRCCLIL